MEIQVKKTKWVEVLEENVVIRIPDEAFTFKVNRDKVMAIPRWSTWNVERFNKPEEIYMFDIIWIEHMHDSEISAFEFHITPPSLNSLLRNITNRNRTDAKRCAIVEYLLTHTDEDIPHRDYLSIEEFKASYKQIVEDLNAVIGI